MTDKYSYEGWAISSDYSGIFCNVELTRVKAIRKHLNTGKFLGALTEDESRHWRRLKRAGYRAVRVRVSPVEKKYSSLDVD